MTSEQDQTEQANRERISNAFEEWAAGASVFFDLLAPDATWTIMGSGPSARTHRGRDVYLEHVMQPLMARLKGPTVPNVTNILAEGDTVVVRWHQSTPTVDGKIYHNSYAWFCTLKNNFVVDVVAFLDLQAYDGLLAKRVG